jgi:uncharacterized RDD family membrane protein YckC
MSDLVGSQSPVAGSLVFASPVRRLGAMFYDSLLCVAILMVATLPFIPLANGRALRPEESGALAYAYWLWLVIAMVLFFGYFWTRKGRTLGMQVWSLRIETTDGKLPSWRDALLRFAAACVPLMIATLTLVVIAQFAAIKLGLAFMILLSVPLVSYLAGYFDAQQRALHERWLSTRVVKA